MTEQKSIHQINETKRESDIHGYARRVELALAQIQQPNLHEEDKRDILRFQHVLRTQKLNSVLEQDSDRVCDLLMQLILEPKHK